MARSVAHGHLLDPQGVTFVLEVAMNYPSMRENYWRALRHFTQVQGRNRVVFVVVYNYNANSNGYSAHATLNAAVNFWELAQTDLEHHKGFSQREVRTAKWPVVARLPPIVLGRVNQLISQIIYAREGRALMPTGPLGFNPITAEEIARWDKREYDRMTPEQRLEHDAKLEQAAEDERDAKQAAEYDGMTPEQQAEYDGMTPEQQAEYDDMTLELEQAAEDEHDVKLAAKYEHDARLERAAEDKRDAKLAAKYDGMTPEQQAEYEDE